MSDIEEEPYSDEEPSSDEELEPSKPKVDSDPVLQSKLQELREAITNPPPFCSGTLALTDDAFTLAYGKRGESQRKSGYIDFLNASEEDLRRLTEACDPATFGKNDQDVLDLSYRTAGKMDTNDFLTDIDLERAGLMDAIRYDLLDGEKSMQPIYAELYNLNVYGVGSFFKTHKDTPRSSDMFGSLVIVFPTLHEGGALVLRHGANETTFDSSALLKNAKEPSVAYVAFFSDVEHEVLPVTAGCRVNITYNLYFREVPPQTRERGSDSQQKMFKTLPPMANTFLSVFQTLLADPMFLPNGGTLGFGLSHKYLDVPSKEERENIGLFVKRLRGRDALVVKACRDLSLPISVKIVYSDDSEGVDILCDQIHDPEFSFDGEQELWQSILDEKDVKGKVIRMGSEPDEQFNVQWVTESLNLNFVKSEYATYEAGNAGLGHLYGSLCFILDVGPPGQRG